MQKQHIQIADSQQPQYDKLRRLEFGAEELASAFMEKPVGIVCIDERARIGHKPVIGLAGTAVLMTDPQREKFIANIREDGIDPSELEFTQHESCGACGLYCKDHPENTPEEMAEKSAKHLAQLAGAKKPVTQIGWTSGCEHEAIGDSHAHHASVIYVDGTGRFNPAKLGLPDGFLLSVKFSPDWDYAKTELAIAQSIAMGDHGLGKDYFKTNGPLLIVLVGDPLSLREKFAGSLDLYSGLAEVLELPYNG